MQRSRGMETNGMDIEHRRAAAVTMTVATTRWRVDGRPPGGSDGCRRSGPSRATVLLLVAAVAMICCLGSRDVCAATEDACDVARVAQTRAAFRTAYAAGDFTTAATALRSIWSDCGMSHHLSAETEGAIANDLALALHRADNDFDCLDVLEEYWPASNAPTAAFTRLPAGTRRAMKFNWGLCSAECPKAAGVSALCDTLATTERYRDHVEGFHQRPCSFATGMASVALPGGACLTLLPPREPFDSSTADQRHLGDICPIPALVTRNGDKTTTTTLQAPPRSFLLSLEHCCQPIDLAIDANGEISAEPHENPPEGCLFGHRTPVMQDIFRLRNGKISLVHQLSEPWFPQP